MKMILGSPLFIRSNFHYLFKFFDNKRDEANLIFYVHLFYGIWLVFLLFLCSEYFNFFTFAFCIFIIGKININKHICDNN
jgi:hypothetical protein